MPRPFSSERERPAPVNWRRGIFRLWVLASVAWIMGWLIYLTIEVIRGDSKMIGDFLVMPIVLFAPPIALLLFGIATRWAFRGFKIDDQVPNA